MPMPMSEPTRSEKSATPTLVVYSVACKIDPCSHVVGRVQFRAVIFQVGTDRINGPTLRRLVLPADEIVLSRGAFLLGRNVAAVASRCHCRANQFGADQRRPRTFDSGCKPPVQLTWMSPVRKMRTLAWFGPIAKTECASFSPRMNTSV
jgi:hypothetical protein